MTHEISQDFVAKSGSNAALFFNREISWLAFNSRVLEEAEREDNPLLERLKFLAISESNLNEFFMVRVAGLKQVVASDVNEVQMDGRTAHETLKEISTQVHAMVERQYVIFYHLIDQLSLQGLTIVTDHNQLEKDEQEFVSDFFQKEVFRVLTPLAVDPSHPFPHIINGSLNQAVKLKRRIQDGRSKDVYAFVEVPSVLPRFLELPAKGNRRKLLPLEEILKLHAGDLFSGTTVISMHGFSITRNSDLSIDEVASDNLLSTIQEELRNRRWGEAVRLNIRSGMPEDLRDFIIDKLDLESDEIYERPGLLNLQDLMHVYGLARDLKDLKDKPFIPRNALPLSRPEKTFSAIRHGDILLHHPFDSFQTIIDLLQFAARDPKVLAIKQTLYRTSGDSPVVRSLIEAAENGKQVTALVELKARFDEQNNIVWAKQMESHGVHVVYGLVGLKIHGKMLQIIRRESDGVRSYVHLSTGNYNPSTARMYTDVGLLTADPEINDDVTNLFHSLTGYAEAPRLKKISAAPISLREKLTELIEREIEHAARGLSGGIHLKLNAIVDPDIISRLYRASQAGVKIRLSVRGICCLKPGIPGVSDRITVSSIVGRFLEHSRIFHFENAGQPEIYLSSADLMPRNLNRRVEVMFPVESMELKNKLIMVLDAVFRDNFNARQLSADGSYARILPAKEEDYFSSQRYFREEANKEFEQKEKARDEKRKQIFQPLTNPVDEFFKKDEVNDEDENG